MKRYIFLILCLLGALACPLVRPLLAQAADDERQVVARGVGMNEDEAKKEAYRNAIQSVIGTMVVAETQVENNALVRDKVLSHSDGYITKVEQIGETIAREGGLVEVHMRVTVKSQQLKEKLQAEKISVREIDGESLLAEATTKKEPAKDAAAIVAEFLKGSGLPASAVDSTADIGQAKVTESNGSSTMTVPIRVSVNMDAYRKFVGDLKKTLNDLGIKGETLNSSTDIGSEGNMWLDGPAWNNFREKFWKGAGPTIAICEMYSLESKQARVTVFKVPKNVLETFAAMSGYVEIKAELYDGGQSLVTSQDIRLAGDSWDKDVPDIIAYASGDATVVVSPALKLLRNDGNQVYISNTRYNPATLQAAFLLANDELKAVKSIKTSAQNGK